MKPEQLEQMLAKASRSVRQLNEHLARVCPGKESFAVGAGDCDPVRNKALARPARRIRQSGKPVLNKLETEALDWLQQIYPSAAFHKQAWRVKIANGSWFKVDLCAFLEAESGLGRWHAWEVKEFRGKNVDRGKLAIKCAAYQFPEIRWHLIWREKGGPWNEQEVLP